MPETAVTDSSPAPATEPQPAAWAPPPGSPGYGYPQSAGPVPGAWWPPFPPAYYERPLKPPYNQRPPFVPGVVFCVVTALVLCPGIIAASGADLGYIEAISVSLGLLMGGIWLLALLVNAQESHFRYNRRTWFRWAAPAAIFFVAVALMGSPIPATVRFNLSEPSLRQAATQTTSNTSYGPRWIGLYQFYDIRVVGPVKFFDLSLPSSESWSQCSYAYAPEQTADFDTWISKSWDVRSLGQDWWYGCGGTSYSD